MQDIGERLKQMVRIFRRESHHLLETERTTVYGADAMLTVLQLVMAQVNKQVSSNHLETAKGPRGTSVRIPVLPNALACY